MNYQQALDYLYSFPDSEAKLPRTPVEFNLPQTTALLRAWDDPQRHVPSVVIAGTKGKGSTAAMLEAIVRASGRRTGLWTSPHLHSYRERIQIDRRPVSQADLIAQIEHVQAMIARFDTERYGMPTIFQLGFAIAMRTFAERQVDLAILEVGLGGRYDSANAITPLLSLITSISYDHMRVLGNTLGQIAYEKAGIAKPGVPLLTVRQQPEAMRVIEDVAREVGAPLHVVEQADARYDLANIALQGTFQRENAALAAAAAALLGERGLSIGPAALAEGLGTAVWPGRMELVDGAPPFVLDGAHNGDSAARLVESLRQRFPGWRVVLVFGTTRDKDLDRMLAALLPAADALVLTHSRHPRALTELAELAATIERLPGGERLLPIEQTSDVPEAIDRARALAGPGDVICVTGSLFVVAAAREALGLAAECD